jgi:8-oxo-dGTP pyrophosphatase MutT (NUDIX family)
MKITSAGIVLYNSGQTHVLLIKDSRSKKWSIPKGQKELFDPTFVHTACREVLEETGLYWFYDYMINEPIGQFNHYMFYEGNVFSDTLRKTSCIEEHVEEIKWVDITTFNNYVMNVPTKNCLTQISAKLHKSYVNND